MKRTIRLLAIAGIAIGVTRVARSLRRGDLRAFVTHRFNPVVMRFGLAGGKASPWGIVEHTGRTSGSTYHTPIYGRTHGDFAYIRLPYGTDVHWVRNIQAAGHCRMQLHETIYDLDEPAIIPASENPMVPASARRALERTGRMYLRLHILGRAPGTFIEREFAPALEPTTIPAPAIEVLHPAVESAPKAITS
jgi:deazaflavin-dependent oxidoreductase (nitroreductase family)